LKQPPADVDVRAAKQRVQDTKDALATATDNLAQLQAGPDQGVLDAAQAAVDKAQQGVRMAQAHAAEVTSHPTPSELANAQDQVRQAQAALEAAKRDAPQSSDEGGADISAAQQNVDSIQAEVNKLQNTLTKTSLLAPFDGTIVAVSTRPDAVITPTTVVFTLARPGPAVVHVSAADDETGRLSVGQSAEVHFDNGTVAAANVSNVIPASPASSSGQSGASTTSESADLKVEWPNGTAPQIGMPVQVSVILQQKQGVLVIPKSAVHQGNPTTVEVQDGGSRRSVNVEIGITNADSAEITAGLTEGQLVLPGSV
jgi:multidrug efflux pump subunit AcrA (membrane-fusion protein)